MLHTGPLLVERRAPGVLLLRLDRPARRNAVDVELADALLSALGEVGGLDERVVVLASSDTRWFCAGADLRIPDGERARVSDRLYEIYAAMVQLPVPVVAAVSGPAVGGGAQLAIAADLRVGDARTRLRFAGPGHGLAVGGWALPSLVGRGRAFELCATSRDVAAEEALAIGLLDRVADDALDGALALAATLVGQDAGALARLKAAATDGLLAALAAERRGNRAWRGGVGV